MEAIKDLGLTGFQLLIVIFLMLSILNYIWLLYDTPYEEIPSGLKEGFESGVITESEKTKMAWFENDELFDDFYISVYDKLMGLHNRFPQQIALIINQWKKKTETGTMDVLDCGCGTGIASVLFAKMNVNSVTGLDLSDSMLRQARNVTLKTSKLNEDQRNLVKFVKGDMNQDSTFKSGEFSHAVLLFFVVYYSTDLIGLFRNLHYWIRPGGQLAIEVVNKYKFDPIIESASPFIGSSIQKYSKKRITKSKVEFDKFSYEAEFDLQDSIAEFREVFRFKDKSIRRQRHTLYMHDINHIVDVAKAAGWKYEGYVDLLNAGFEYAYVLMFTHA